MTAQAALKGQVVVRDAAEAAHAVPCVGCASEGFAGQLVYSLAHGDGDILRRPRALQFVDARRPVTAGTLVDKFLQPVSVRE